MEVRRRAGIGRELASRADQRVLRWFGDVKRMDAYRIARMALMAEVGGGWIKVKVQSSFARSLPVENLLPQKVGSIINYFQ